MTAHTEVPISLLSKLVPPPRERGVKARRGKMSQPRLIRKIWEVGAEQPERVSTAPSSNSSEEGWRQS